MVLGNHIIHTEHYHLFPFLSEFFVIIKNTALLIFQLYQKNGRKHRKARLSPGLCLQSDIAVMQSMTAMFFGQILFWQRFQEVVLLALSERKDFLDFFLSEKSARYDSGHRLRSGFLIQVLCSASICQSAPDTGHFHEPA